MVKLTAAERYERMIRGHIKNYKNYRMAYDAREMAVKHKDTAHTLAISPFVTEEIRKTARKLIANSNKLIKEVDSVILELQYQSEKSVKVIYENYKKLIFKMVNRYKKSRKDLRDTDDLMSTAMIAYAKALEGFDLDKNIKFSTYLTNGLRNEIIGSYRRGVRQAEVEPCNVTEYFYQNEKAVDLTPLDSASENDPRSIASYYDTAATCDSFNELAVDDETFEVAEFLRNISELTMEESMAFMMHAGIDNNHYTKKDMKRMFNLGESYLDSSKLKVFSAYQIRDAAKLRDRY